MSKTTATLVITMMIGIALVPVAQAATRTECGILSGTLADSNCGTVTSNTKAHSCGTGTDGVLRCTIENKGSAAAFDWVNPGSWFNAAVSGTCHTTIPDKTWTIGGHPAVTRDCSTREEIQPTQCKVFKTTGKATYGGTLNPGTISVDSSVRVCN